MDNVSTFFLGSKSANNYFHTGFEFQNDRGLSESDSLLHFEPIFGSSDRTAPIDISKRMWSLDYIGLYSNYAAIGLLNGMSGLTLNFCVYVYDGDSNLCISSMNMMMLAWCFKLFYALVTDSYQPWGMRRKPYIIIGWSATMVVLLVLTILAPVLSAVSWLAINMMLFACAMVAIVQADGYCVELGKQESPETRGQVLATAQMIRFGFSMVASIIQTLLVNGPSTNSPECRIAWGSCWSFGLNVQQYYALVLVLCCALLVPVLYLKDSEGKHVPSRTNTEFLADIWDTLQSRTVFCLIVYVVGISTLAQLPNKVAMIMQYYVIRLTSSQAGLDALVSNLATVAALGLFKSYLINMNWRITNYLSCGLATVFGVMWIFVFYNVGGLRNPWFSVFIDLNQSFSLGLSQVLFSMAVIEMAKPGQESSTYELLVSVANAAWLVSGIVSSLLLVPFRAGACSSKQCDSDTVNVQSVDAYVNSNGPMRFTWYTLIIVGLGLAGTLGFTRFLPRSKQECHLWDKEGRLSNYEVVRGMFSLVLALVVIASGIVASILLLDEKKSCLKYLGGSGC